MSDTISKSELLDKFSSLVWKLSDAREALRDSEYYNELNDLYWTFYHLEAELESMENDL